MSRRDVDLSTVNLNLMVGLDALLTERGVTRAADRVGLTQSAMSRVLGQLRELFDDELLVRGAGGRMVPTPKAEALALPVAQGLAALRRALVGEVGFDPATSQRRFSIATQDATAAIVLPRLVQRLAELGPRVDLDVVPFDARRFAAELEAGSLDLVLNVGIPDAPGLRARGLWRERFVCVLRRGHPAAGGLDLATWAALDHVLVSPQGGGGPGVVDTALAAHGLERRVAVRLRSFLAATLLVARTDLVMTVSAHLAAEVGPGMGLIVLPSPVELPGFGVRMGWHERFDADPGLRWLRERLAEVGASLGGPRAEGDAPA